MKGLSIGGCDGPGGTAMWKSVKLGLLGFVVGSAWIVAGAAWTAAWAQYATPLKAVAQGEWELSEIDGPGHLSVCVTDPGTLLQLGQGKSACTRQVLDSGRSSMTVHYTCSGSGQGRSILTVRSAGSIRLETQGVTRGAPFAADYDGKRIGPCPSR